MNWNLFENLSFKTLFVSGPQILSFLDQNKCHPNPCRNGGICTGTNEGDGFECTCREGYKGKSCEGKVYNTLNKNPMLYLFRRLMDTRLLEIIARDWIYNCSFLRVVITYFQRYYDFMLNSLSSHCVSRCKPM